MRIIGALLLTPFVAVGVLFVVGILLSIVEEYGEDILGIGFLLGWLALIFSVIYRLLS